MAQPETKIIAEAPRQAAERSAPAAPSGFHEEVQAQRRPPGQPSVQSRQPSVSAQPEYRTQSPATGHVYSTPETGVTFTGRSPWYAGQGEGQQIGNHPVRTNPIEGQNPGVNHPPERFPIQNDGDGYGRGYGQFGPPREFRPPEGRGWGWQDPDRWRRGWDPFFFQQDPNYETWQPGINQESTNIAGALNANDTQTAANELNNDLWAMRGDIYGQNELLQQVQSQTQPGEGAQLYLGQWDPTRGSWDDIRVEAQPAPPGYQSAPSFKMQTFE